MEYISQLDEMSSYGNLNPLNVTSSVYFNGFAIINSAPRVTESHHSFIVSCHHEAIHTHTFYCVAYSSIIVSTRYPHSDPKVGARHPKPPPTIDMR